MTDPNEERARQFRLQVERAVECGKRCYIQKNKAWKAAQSSSLDLVPYLCPTCSFWHLTKRKKTGS